MSQAAPSALQSRCRGFEAGYYNSNNNNNDDNNIISSNNNSSNSSNNKTIIEATISRGDSYRGSPAPDIIYVYIYI